MMLAVLLVAMPISATYIDSRCGYRIEVGTVEKRDEPCSVLVNGSVVVTLPKSAPKKPEPSLELTRGRWRGWTTPTRALLRDPSGNMALLEGENVQQVLMHFVFLGETGDAWCSADNLSQQELNQCKYAQYLQTDSRLVTMWDKLLADVEDEESKSRLRKAHEAWLAFRQLACDADAYVVAAGGSAQSFVFNECRTDITLDRIEQLESLNEWRSE
jgi:uncharacterized protein YecT (DUF1311 family)